MIPIQELPRSNEYNDYLKKHIGGVYKSYEEILKPLIKDKISPELLNKCFLSVYSHDDSKYDVEEYVPYLHYFYPTEDIDPESKEIKDAFNYAWLRHIHLNPHHYQHWMLQEDDGDLICLDMPYEEIVAMVCDWSSFKYIYPGSTANSWYKKNGHNMKLSDNTRRTVEELLALSDEL